MSAINTWTEINKKVNGFTIYIVLVAWYFLTGSIADIKSNQDKTSKELTEIKLTVKILSHEVDNATVKNYYMIQDLRKDLKAVADTSRYVFEQIHEKSKRYLSNRITQAKNVQNEEIQNIVKYEIQQSDSLELVKTKYGTIYRYNQKGK